MSKNNITAYIPIIFKGIRPGWKRILFHPTIKPILNKSLKALDEYLRDHGVTAEYMAKNGLSSYIRPAENNIFEFMKYCDPQNIKCIIIGQDPYTKSEEAHGLSFSVPRDTYIPPSLRVIFECLLNHDLISVFPEHGNLTNWARQGVILMNRYLTRSPNIVKSNDKIYIEGNGDSKEQFLHSFWGELTNELLRYLTTDFLEFDLNHKKHELYLLLWGEKAKSVSLFCNPIQPPGKAVHILEWGHPSLSNAFNRTDTPQNFRNCNHFLLVPNINWDPDFVPDYDVRDQFYTARLEADFNFEAYVQSHTNLYDDGTKTVENLYIREFVLGAPQIATAAIITASIEMPVAMKSTSIIVAVDGACTDNGKENAIASYGVYFPEKYGDQNNAICKKMYGLVPRNKIETVGTKIVQTEAPMTPTNNRGELIAAIYALREIRDWIVVTKPSGCTVQIIADSNYVINILRNGIWKWNYAKKKNPDLLVITSAIIMEIANLINPTQNCQSVLFPGVFTLHHQPSHENEKTVSKSEYEKWFCNSEADLLCNKALQDLRDDYQLHLC